MPNNDKLLPRERHKEIIKLLKENSIVKISELVEIFNISIDTVRRDLEYLENREYLKRIHGGAILSDEEPISGTFAEREIKNLPQKQQIAKTVLSYVTEGMSIGLNSGTTQLEIAKELVLNYDRLTILTNSVKIMEILIQKKGFVVIVPGGILNSDEFSIYGSHCEEDIMQYNMDIAIISASAISLKRGVTDRRITEIGAIKAFLNASRRRILAIDHSKFEKVSIAAVCDLNIFESIITDPDIPVKIADEYRAKGMDIIIKTDKT